MMSSLTLREHEGGPRSNSPFTPPWISKLGTTNILRRTRESNTFLLNDGVLFSCFFCSSSADIFSLCSSSTADAMDEASDEDSFFICRTRDACLAILAASASISSCRDSASELDMLIFFFSVTSTTKANGDVLMDGCCWRLSFDYSAVYSRLTSLSSLTKICGSGYSCVVLFNRPSCVCSGCTYEFVLEDLASARKETRNPCLGRVLSLFLTSCFKNHLQQHVHSNEAQGNREMVFKQERLWVHHSC